MLSWELWLAECGLSIDPCASNHYSNYYELSELQRWFNNGVDPWEVQAAVTEFQLLDRRKGAYERNRNRGFGTSNSRALGR